MRGLLGSAYRRANAASAGLCKFWERLWDSSFRAPFVFSDTTGGLSQLGRSRYSAGRREVRPQHLPSRADYALQHVLEGGPGLQVQSRTNNDDGQAEFRRLRPGIQTERKSLISWAEQF